MIRPLPATPLKEGHLQGARQFRAGHEHHAGAAERGDQHDSSVNERIARLEQSVKALLDAQSEVTRKAAVVEGAGRDWRVLGRFGPNVMFVSAAGDIAGLPADLVELIRGGRRVDATVEVAGGLVLFRQGTRELARVPASLVVVLSTLLKGLSHEA